MFILFNNNGVFEPPITFAAAADFDGDGYSDGAVSNTDSATLSVLLNLGDGALGPPIDFPIGLQPRAIDANNSAPLDVCSWGAVGPEDLIALLGAWGVVDDPVDFEDPSGVGPEDLIVLLGNWGECP